MLYYAILYYIIIIMVFIYVLQLIENKWYIGKTETSKFRIDTHFHSNGSEFTKKYSPLDIYQIIPECDKYDEDKYVKKYMDKYGIDNVRGGSYSRLKLTDEEKKHIQKELWGVNGLCFICGGDHFVKDCPNNKEPEQAIEEKDDSSEKDETARWIEYYENKLFELTEGCWVCRTQPSPYPHHGGWRETGEGQVGIGNISLPYKIYRQHDNPPINFPDVIDIKYMLDNVPTNTFERDVGFNGGFPKHYSVILNFKGHISTHYYYCFSKLKYPMLVGRENLAYTTELLVKEKKDIEYKLFMLKK